MVGIVVAHEDVEESHNRYTLEQLKLKLDKEGEAYEVVDLYQEEFDPVLSFKEEHPDLKRYETFIETHNKFIFIYPIWWNAPPAILKGFLEIVFHQGFAFHFEPTGIPNVGRPIGHLKGKRAVTLTTSGSPTWLFWAYQRKRGKKVVKKDVLEMSGMTVKSYHTGGAQRLSDKTKGKIEKNVTKAVDWL